MPCRCRPLPVELVNEFVSFVPGLFCRKFVLPANSQFFYLLLRSKRSKIWKSETVDVREESALYTFGQMFPPFSAIIPRLPDHRDALTLSMQRIMFLENLAIGRLLPLYELLHPNGHSQWIMSLRARNVPDSRPTVWAFFQTNSGAIASRFHCAFHPIQLTDANVEWDAALVSFADRVAWRHNWNPLTEQIRSALAQIESGEVPSDVDPSPYDLPPSDSPPSLGGL
ncbi:hypothetical protein niasHT_001662 [Heterodera trifolii]|uniref:Uncharacterized protein n=1 Tax=Heterodera trifolii TaxID=157864 RepID=A0ABD2M3L9_9BILA